MKSRMTKLTVAALIIIACVIGLSLWKATSSGIVLADVLARIEKVKAVRYKSTFTMIYPDLDPNDPDSNFRFVYTHLASGEYGWKEIGESLPPNGGKGSVFQERYFLPQKKTFILISPAQKKYRRRELKDDAIEYIQKVNIARNPFMLLKEVLNTKYKSMGRSTIDGVEVEGFRTTDPNCRGGAIGFKDAQVDVKVWVDVKTRLPVRYESLTSGHSEMGDKMSHHFAMHDFQWDVAVDASEFEPPPVPDGYEVVDRDRAGVIIDEETAIQGLKQCIELFGSYITISEGERRPARATLSALEKSETPAALQLKEEIKGLTEREKLNRVRSVGNSVIQFIRFYMGLVQNKKDPAYYGKTVTPKDADKVLLRWKVSDNEYRVIYGDLHAETVTPEKLAELEAALPK